MGKPKKKSNIFARVSALVVAEVLIASLLALLLVNQLEEGVVDVCALQQDAYVQLVLDQINLKENRDNESIINDILATMDSSTTKYWTFSQDQDMLFVKDVLESNRYRGLTAESYYASPSGLAFLDALEPNHVIHRSITLHDQDYVASGVEFLYQGREYRLCLLTNRDVLLDNNEFLQAKSQLGVLFLTLMVVAIALPMALARKLYFAQQQIEQQEGSIRRLHEALGRFNDQLAMRDMHNTRENLWQTDMLPRFIQSLQDRELTPVMVAQVHCPDQPSQQQFLMMASYTLDHHVLRFQWTGFDVLLIFFGGNEDQARLSILSALPQTAALAKVASAPDQRELEALIDTFQDTVGA